jgi:hypothetical protein
MAPTSCCYTFPRVRRLLIGLLLLTAAGCSEPPQKEIDQAQSALDAARTAGADKYAAEEYSDASATLQKAHASVDQRDYRQALSYALDARQRAIEASRQVPDGRTRAKTSVDILVKTTGTRADRLDAALKTAEEAKVPARELRTPRATLTAARTSLQEARRLIDTGNFAEAAATVAGVREKVDTAVKAVESIPPRARPVKGKKR